MKTWKPQPHLRQKRFVDCNLSDRELFGSLELGNDLWDDAKLVDCYRYIRMYKLATVPDSWQSVFDDFDRELDRVCSREI